VLINIDRSDTIIGSFIDLSVVDLGGWLCEY